MADESLIHARWIVPVEPAGAVLRDYAVAVRGGSIEAVLPSAAARARFPDYEETNLDNHVLIPGLVNAHSHAALSLLRGLHAQAAALEAKHLSAEFVRDGAQVACMEMALGGITCFNDMYFFPEAALQAAVSVGLRSAHGMIVAEGATSYASDAQDYIRKGLELRDGFRDQPLISFCLAAYGPVSDETLRKIATLAAELDVPVHLQLDGTPGEIERLRGLGLLGPGLIAAHCVHVKPGDVRLLAQHGCSVVHCPTSSLGLANGSASVEALAGAGVNMALGTARNDRLDMFQEMRTAALLNARAFPAHAALHAATLAGACALGLERTVGSIVPGKAADLVAIALHGANLVPCHDPVALLVQAAGREDVSHVWVAGRPLVGDGKPLKEAFPGLDTRIQLWQNTLSAGS